MSIIHYSNASILELQIYYLKIINLHFVVATLHFGFKCWILEKHSRKTSDVFESWCWRRLFKIPWIAIKPNKCLIEQSFEYSFEAHMIILKFSYFGHILRRYHFLEKSMVLGKVGRREWPTAKWMDSIRVARGTPMEELKSQVGDRSS